MNKARSPSLTSIAELDVMIARAEGACERYWQATTKPGQSPPVLRRKVQTLKKMEETLGRLRAQRDAPRP
jgi:hypothetical protein